MSANKHLIVILFAVLTAIFAIPVFAASTVAPVTPGGGSIPDFSFQIPIGSLHISGADITSGSAIAQYIGAVYEWLVGFAAVLAVLAFTYGGVLWLIAGGESSKVTESKKVMGNALVGLLLAIGSYVFLATISPNLVTFNPLTVASINPITLKLTALAAVPSTTTSATRVGSMVGPALSSTMTPAMNATICQLTCTGKGARDGKTYDAVVIDPDRSPVCTCKERSTGATCTEPNTDLSRQATCSDICPIGAYYAPQSAYAIKLKSVTPHADAAGTPYYCCNCLFTTSTAPGTPPSCGLNKDQMCCGEPDGGVVCGNNLYPVKKSSFTNENKCQCENGTEGSICNFATGQGCGPGLTCKRAGLCAFGGCWSPGAGPEDGECKK